MADSIFFEASKYVNFSKGPNTEKTIMAAFEFSFLMNIPNITLVGEISQSKVNVTADDDESLKKNMTKILKEKIWQKALSTHGILKTMITMNLMLKRQKKLKNW